MRVSKVTAVVGVATAAALVVAGCSSSKKSTSTGAAGADSAECAPYKAYQGKSGKVTMYATIADPEAGYLKQSWAPFEKCTGITIQYTSDKEFETQLKIKVSGGNAPDIAIIPQPGLLQSMAATGKLKEPDATTLAEAKKNWSTDWVNYGSAGGKFYAAPMGGNFKSLVWYSPKTFKDKGYTVPTTWDQLIALSDKVAATGAKPWCAGIESGTATGWTATDWLEEVMLRLNGPDVYDQGGAPKLPVNAPKVEAALAIVGSILKNPKYVNGGIGDVKSIATTSFAKAGLPIVNGGKCTLHAQAGFYAANWPKTTKVGPDGDVFAFYEPTMSSKFGQVVEGGGEFVAAFSDKPAVQAVQEYLATSDWATAPVTVHSGWLSANKGVPLSTYTDPVDSLSAKLLTDPKSVFRFDASDLMPATVGSGTFWTQMTQWILGQDDKTTLTNIENSWPK